MKTKLWFDQVWWLRKACQRARCMVASRTARKFGLKILEHIDVHSYDQVKHDKLLMKYIDIDS